MKTNGVPCGKSFTDMLAFRIYVGLQEPQKPPLMIIPSFWKVALAMANIWLSPLVRLNFDAKFFRHCPVPTFDYDYEIRGNHEIAYTGATICTQEIGKSDNKSYRISCSTRKSQQIHWKVFFNPKKKMAPRKCVQNYIHFPGHVEKENIAFYGLNSASSSSTMFYTFCTSHPNL